MSAHPASLPQTQLYFPPAMCRSETGLDRKERDGPGWIRHGPLYLPLPPYYIGGETFSSNPTKFSTTSPASSRDSAAPVGHNEKTTGNKSTPPTFSEDTFEQQEVDQPGHNRNQLINVYNPQGRRRSSCACPTACSPKTAEQKGGRPVDQLAQDVDGPVAFTVLLNLAHFGIRSDRK